MIEVIEVAEIEPEDLPLTNLIVMILDPEGAQEVIIHRLKEMIILLAEVGKRKEINKNLGVETVLSL
jgi:hypothetical protein